MIQSVLTDIPGIGEKTTQKLLAEFTSVANVRDQSLETLIAFIGKSNGNKVFNYFHHTEEKTEEEVPSEGQSEDKSSEITDKNKS